MDNHFFKGKKVTVFGLGLHGGGVGIVRFLVAQGAKVVVTDIKTREDLKSSMDKLNDLKGVTFVLGQHRIEDFTKTDLVIKNPGIPWDNKNIKMALEKKIPVEMDSSLFFQLCKNPIIGVTGTKGKTTTSLAIFEMLKSAGRDVIKVGIFQVSVLDKLAELKKDTVVVFELSSWRLSALGRIKMSPGIAVMTNLFPDHLNYYKSMAEYAEDKKNIFRFQKNRDWLIANADNAEVLQMAAEAPAQVMKFSSQPIKNGKNVFLDEETIFWNNGIDVKKIADTKELKIRGRHNIGNLMAAAGACFAYGLTLTEVRRGLLEFKGVAHRLEFVRSLSGVKYYNDTAATIPEAAISALQSFTEPIVLIAGGNDKGLQYAQFAKAILEKAKKVVFIKGTGTDKILAEIAKLLGGTEKEYPAVTYMHEAVAVAKDLAETGDVVLLSSGTASFGVFQNEFDRGDKFKKAVMELK